MTPHSVGENETVHKTLTLIATIAAFAVAAPIAAQQAAAPAGIKRTMLQKVEVPGTNYETVTAIAEVPPATSAGRHTHPGPETGYVVEGSMTLIVEGKPPVTLKAGDSYQIPPGAVHDVKTAEQPMKVMAVYVVEKGKPLASPAP